MQYFTENFTSLNELIRTLDTRKANKVFECRRGNLASQNDDYDFTRTHSYKEAVELLKNGYTEPLAEIKKGVETNARGMTAQKTEVKNDVVGYAPCVPNAILGIPQSMINKKTAVKKSKIITIIHDAHESAWVSGKTFTKAGITTLSIVNSLEAQGYRVALKVAFFDGSYGKEKVFATAKLKDWRQPLDFKKITFPFCHPSMLRRIGFKYLETHPKITESGFSIGYSHPDACRKYDSVLTALRKNKLIADNEFYININLCEKNSFNPQAVAKACGLGSPDTIKKKV